MSSMRTFSVKDDNPNPDMLREAAAVLKAGELVCFPCGSNYRIAADVNNADSVLKLFQSKRRTGKAATLVFVADAEMLSTITGELDAVTERLIKNVWPGNLTILVEPHLELPRRVLKLLSKSRKKIGVRVPAGDTAQGIVRAFGGPLLISSANIEKKKGAYSFAQVRKNFLHAIELFFDAGDLSSSPPSTVVEVRDGEISVIRSGGVSENELRQFAGA